MLARVLAAAILAVLAPLAGAGLRTGALLAQTIDTIVIQRRDVFGPSSGAPPAVARLGDALHMMTRERVIRRTLLIDPGDPYDSARVAEAERELRRLGVFRDVAVDTGRIGDRLALRVRTADGWSTKPQLEFRSAGGDATWQVGLVEENLLGTATFFGAIYGRTPDRDFLTFDYSNRAVFARRARLDLTFNELTDGRTGSWSYGVPFTETASRGALLTYGWAGDQRILVWRDAALDTTLRREAFVAGGVAGLATSRSTTGYVRTFLRGAVRREDYATDTVGAPIGRSVFGQLAVGIETAHSRWVVRENIDSYGRREDVDLSARAGGVLWALPAAFGYPADRSGVGLEGYGQMGGVWGRAVTVLQARAHGVLAAGAVDSGRVGARLTMAVPARRQTLLLRAEGAAARGTAPGSEYDLWAMRIGPRLFPAHAYTGTRAWAATIEDRIRAIDDAFGLLSIGIAPFVDAGGAWYADEARRTGGNAGLALRLGPTRAASGEVFEVAGGYRWSSDGSTTGWGFSFGTAYRFFGR